MSNQHSYLNFNCSNSVCSLSPPFNVVNTYADSGASNTYFRLKDVANNKVATQNSIIVTQANGDTMQSTHIANMNLPTLSSEAKIGHVIPNLSSASLLSIGQLCDDDCLALFTKEKVFIFKQNKLLLQGKRNFFNGMWTIPVPIQSVSVPSPNTLTKTKLKTTLQVHNVLHNKNHQNFSKVVNKLKYLLQHVHNIKLMPEF